MPTISLALNHQSDRLNSKIDAEALLQFVLSKPRSHLYSWPEKELSIQESLQYEKLCDKRLQGQPIAYLIGYKEFYSRNFKVNHHTLIPRPETELIIDTVLELNETQNFKNILDLGTGSGIIAITLSLELENLSIDACDISETAIDIARINATTLDSNNHFIKSNWFQSIKPKTYDLVISNPPYIEEDDLHLKEGDLRFEPKTALSSGLDGLRDIENIIKESTSYLSEKGLLILEHGYNQKVAINDLFSQYGFAHTRNIQDSNNLDRITIGYLH